MRLRWLYKGMTVILMVAVGCSTPPTQTTSRPTDTPVPPTATTLPTLPPVPVATLMPAVQAAPSGAITVCATGCDFGAIQAAIDAASTLDGAVIEIRDPIRTEGGITVHKDVVIRGLGVDSTTVQAHEAADEAPDRVFLVEEGVSAVLESMTIRHGRPSVREDHGGGIMNQGRLTVRDCIVTRNLAGGGAGIANNGELAVINSTVSHNTAQDIGPPGTKCGSGAGILSRIGTLTVINSTIHANEAGTGSRGTGGGVRIGCKCTAVLANTTISGNRSVRYGGGIAVLGTLQLLNCTVTENSSKAEGAGIYVGHRLDFQNTVIASNRGSGGECAVAEPGATSGAGAVGLNRNNLVGDGSCAPDYTGDPMLGPLADNGGSTWTHALLPGSPAIDAIPAGGCALAIDQRGMVRPVGRTSPDSPCDIGAFEVQP